MSVDARARQSFGGGSSGHGSGGPFSGSAAPTNAPRGLLSELGVASAEGDEADFAVMVCEFSTRCDWSGRAPHAATNAPAVIKTTATRR
jgi:hypothetical protein